MSYLQRLNFDLERLLKTIRCNPDSATAIPDISWIEVIGLDWPKYKTSLDDWPDSAHSKTLQIFNFT